MNRVDNSLDDDIDSIGIGGTDVVAELGVATGPLSQWQRLEGVGRDKQVGDFKGKEASLVRQDERLGRAMSSDKDQRTLSLEKGQRATYKDESEVMVSS